MSYSKRSAAETTYRKLVVSVLGLMGIVVYLLYVIVSLASVPSSISEGNYLKSNTYFTVIHTDLVHEGEGIHSYDLIVRERETDSVDFITINNYHDPISPGDEGFWHMGEDWNGDPIRMIDWF